MRSGVCMSMFMTVVVIMWCGVFVTFITLREEPTKSPLEKWLCQHAIDDLGANHILHRIGVRSVEDLHKFVTPEILEKRFEPVAAAKIWAAIIKDK